MNHDFYKMLTDLGIPIVKEGHSPYFSSVINKSGENVPKEVDNRTYKKLRKIFKNAEKKSKGWEVSTLEYFEGCSETHNDNCPSCSSMEYFKKCKSVTNKVSIEMRIILDRESGDSDGHRTDGSSETFAIIKTKYNPHLFQN